MLIHDVVRASHQRPCSQAVRQLVYERGAIDAHVSEILCVAQYLHAAPCPHRRHLALTLKRVGRPHHDVRYLVDAELTPYRLGQRPGLLPPDMRPQLAITQQV